jgi:hypothetical protein
VRRPSAASSFLAALSPITRRSGSAIVAMPAE